MSRLLRAGVTAVHTAYVLAHRLVFAGNGFTVSAAGSANIFKLLQSADGMWRSRDNHVWQACETRKKMAQQQGVNTTLKEIVDYTVDSELFVCDAMP